MIGCLCMNGQSACTDARPGQVGARALCAQHHCIPSGIGIETGFSARIAPSKSARKRQGPRISTCHTPEIHRLWHTIPIATASPAV